MEPILSTNAVPAGQSQTVRSVNETSGNNPAMMSSDFETFLRLLTTQMENQDPQNPMESSEFAVQLATFSGVEQQVRTNELLENLVTRSDATGLSESASWVGMEARSPAKLYFDGTSLDLTPQAIPGADRAMLVVKNDLGEEMGRQEIPNDGSTVTWLGTGTDGAILPIGSYRFSVEGFAGNSRIATNQIETYGTVSELQAGLDGPVLILSDGSRVLAEDVTALRIPNSVDP